MTTPTPEQVDAVFSEAYPYLRHQVPKNVIRRVARGVLITDDPETHAALAANLPTDVLLAALVARGELSA